MKNPMYNITLNLETTRLGVRWAQDRIAADHYLHAPVDSRSKPLVYMAHHQATWGAAATTEPSRFWMGMVKTAECQTTQQLDVLTSVA